ncbi:sodium:solute symporter [Amycolatopsis sp. VS8301801F10]|uniref:sodium:solute symporter family protein n=1 Tax=Amycolatopsis sp. VS8301801F10 TaxID=2652442 RepID=UPI0038FC4832
MNAGAVVALAVVALAVAIGLAARGRKQMDLEQWTVAGRSYGTLLFWVLAAGETYSTFTYLGASGFAYANGGAAFYIAGYGTCAFVLSYFFLPPLWRYAKKHNLVTQADFFTHRFRSPWFGALTAIVGVAFMIPYIEAQLLGLGQIVETTTGIHRVPSMVLAVVLIAVFVYASGMKAAAWVSVLKDILLIGTVLVVGIAIPVHYFGGFGHLIDTVQAQHPGFLGVPAPGSPLGVPWMMSTLLVTSAAFFMFPHALAAMYTAKSEQTIRRNAIYLPLYQILIALTLFVGFAAVLVVPGLKGSATNGALLSLTVKTMPSWVVGLVGGAGALAAIVPISLLLLQSATLLARNVYQGVLRPKTTELGVFRLSRALVVVVTAVALVFAVFQPALLVNLLLTGQNGVSQFFPAIVLGLVWRRLTKAGAATGLVVGVAIVAWTVLASKNTLWGLNPGLLAIVVNVVLTVGVSLATSQRREPAVRAEAAEGVA